MHDNSALSTLAVTINPGQVILKDFLGFGAEWDSNGYPAAGINETDFALIKKRVAWMRLPLARIMAQCKWCYRGNGQYDWDNRNMHALYRQLDTCEELGIGVLLTDWGVEPAWLSTPETPRVDVPLYAEIIGTYLDQLIHHRGYTCIRNFITVNEPNGEVKDYHRWKMGVENIASEFARRGLDHKLVFTGPDTVGDENWFRNTVNELSGIMGAYDLHRYSTLDEYACGTLQAYLEENWQYVKTHDPDAANKPLIVGEAGMAVGPGGASNPLHMDPAYGVMMADYAAQAVHAGSSAVLAWMLDDNSHKNFTWGMWLPKTEGMKLKPWFTVWALLSRLFRPGSTVVSAPSPSPDLRVLAAKNKTGGWSICLVNRASHTTCVHLHIPSDSPLQMQRYDYSVASGSTMDQDGFPVPSGMHPFDANRATEISCNANAVVFLSSLPNENYSI